MHRDERAIRNFCTDLRVIWRKVPMLRFGQLITLVFSEIEAGGADPFYTEDARLLDVMRDYVDNLPIKH